MDNDRIVSQIEQVGARRLAGCLARFALLLVACGVALGLVVRGSQAAPVRIAAVCVVAGLIFGFAASILTSAMRKLLRSVFVLPPLAAVLTMFVLRTLFGWDKELPLLGIISPALFSAAFLLAQVISGDASPPARS